MSVKFIIDSASDILPKEANELGVTHLPLRVFFGEEEYTDGVSLSHQDFYKKLEESEELPKTSQVPPADFEECYERLTAEGNTVVVITLSSKLSGTYQSAMIAAEDYEGKVFVVDSRNVAIGERILLLRGLELAKQGMSAEEIAKILNKEKWNIRLYAVVDTLEYLKKGGRISAATALAGNLLSVKPLIEVRDGEVGMLGKARGKQKAAALLRDTVKGSKGIDYEKPYAMTYSGPEDELMQKFIANYPEFWENKKELITASVGCAIGTHVGPGAYGIAFFER